MVVIGVLSVLFFPLVKTRIVGESMYEIRSTSERIDGYREAWELFKQHPWIGVGAGNYTVALQTMRPHQPGWAYQPVHNVGALIAVELGIIGGVLCIFTLLSSISYLISPTFQYGVRILSHRTFISHAFSLYYWLPITGYWLLFSLDHYLFSLYIGLLLSAVFFGFEFRIMRETVPTLSTE